MNGRLEVICGPMYSGKTEELIRRYSRLQIAKQSVVAIKPAIDTRYELTNIISHSKYAIPNVKRMELQDDFLATHAGNASNIFIDEAQFFGPHLVFQIMHRVNAGKRVVVSGLDMDYRREPFGIMPHLMAIADSVTKLCAVCHTCGEDAIFTQRLIEGRPAPFSGDTIKVGGLDSYEARCRRHFEEG